MFQFFQLSDYFGQMQVHMLVASDAIATQNFLGRKSRNTLLIMLQTSLPPLLAANLPTASLNRTGRSWSTWPVRTSRKNKCLGLSGSMQLSTLLG
jgi:hypothetical protein